MSDELAIECRKGNLNIVKELHESGHKINSVNTNTDPLWCAVMAGHYDIVEYLLECGSEITKDKFGQSTIDVALREENYAIASILFDYS